MVRRGAGSPLDAFNEALRCAGQGVFLMDYDGTLAPFHAEVAAVRPYPGVVELLDAMLDTGRARIVVVTGRYLRAASPVLPTRNPLELWGSHGRERRWPDGRYAVAGIDGPGLEALTLADGWFDDVAALGGRSEAKPGSLAYHWRGLPAEAAAEIHELLLARFATAGLHRHLELLPFDGGIELRVRGRNKGDVVREVLAEVPEKLPVTYLGDDLTDEDAFEALRGRGLGVLVRPERRSTAAATWVQPPRGLLRLLEQWRTCLLGERVR